MPLRIYHLKRVAKKPEYDVYNGFVVRATSPKKARQLCAAQASDEGADTWLSPSKSTCTALGYAFDNQIKSEIILRDFNAG